MRKPKRLTCAVCGESAIGRQWWNRDKGFGLCDRCPEYLKAKHNVTPEEMKLSYGVEGIHYKIEVAK